ncbi:MAG: Y-family DNA polymerase [Longimicrobiales bacterium]
MSVDRRILLADCDCYFVQVARLEDPDGAGREPLLLVGGSPDGRGVVTSASYEVRAYGVRSGMPMAQALRLCPKAAWTPVPRGACARKHREIHAVLDRFVPVVEAASIDEFYLDLSGTERVYNNRALTDVAVLIRQAVLEETRISLSIGGGTNRLIAKLAARRAKPAGVLVVPTGEELEFMRTLSLASLPGVGPRFQQRLRAYGLTMVTDVLPHERTQLATWFGEGVGDWLFDRIRGRDGARVHAHGVQKSISRDETFAHDLHDDEALSTELLQLVVRAGRDLRATSLRARTVTVRIRDADFTTRQASRTVSQAIESDRIIFQVASKLLARLRKQRRARARLLGVSLSNLTAASGPAQLALFGSADTLESERDRRVAHTLDRVRGRFGSRALLPGRILRSE